MIIYSISYSYLNFENYDHKLTTSLLNSIGI